LRAFVNVLDKWSGLSKESQNLSKSIREKKLYGTQKRPLHFNKIKKKNHKAWEELANEINRIVDECKTTMEELLSSVGREKMK